MVLPLTSREQRVLEFIESYIQQNSRPPTNREIGKACGITSTSHVAYCLKNLQEKGYLERFPNTSRGLRLSEELRRENEGATVRVPIIGQIAAGQPIEAFREHDGDLELSREMVKRGAYALRVKGRSMIDDLIDDGDLVVVQPTSTAQPGDTVVALLNGPGEEGEVTLKRYFRGPSGTIRLQPANAGMKPIFVKPDEIRIQGKVVSVIRRVH